MRLTDTAVKNAKPKEKPYRLTDGRGMYLLVNQSGKYFRLDYRLLGKRKTLALGTYPTITLKRARKRLEEAKQLIEKDIDPVQHRKRTRALKTNDIANSFEVVSRAWYDTKKGGWSESHAKRVLRNLEKDVFPWMGGRPISTIDPPELLRVLQRIEDRGAYETAHKVKITCGQIFRYAIAPLGLVSRDPTTDLRGALKSRKVRHMPTITDPKRVGELLRAVDGYQGYPVTRYALNLAPLVFVRPGELRQAEWQEIEFDQAEWRIPAEKMKMDDAHIVPLSKQAIEILQEIEPLTGGGRYVFPSLRTSKRPMSNNTINGALRRMGFGKDEMTAHGFRAMASTILHEQGWPSDVIERQLAHAERNSIKAAYNHAQHLPERREMMQHWADYLDGLKEAGKVIPIFKAG